MHRPLHIVLSIFIAGSHSEIACNVPNKICISYPEKQYPVIEIGLETIGSQIVVEILHHRLRADWHVAVAYSKDAKAGHDVVVYCGRKSPPNSTTYGLNMFVNMGIAKNHDFMILTILGNVLYQGGAPFYAQPLEYSQQGEEIYCKMRHHTSEIFSMLGSGKGHLLISQGPWVKRLDVPSREAFDLGVFDFQNFSNKKSTIFTVLMALLIL